MAKNLKQGVGLRVRAFRRASGLTQERLADLIERSTETVSNIERGQTLPGLDTLESLARHLGVPLSDFFDEGRSAKNRKRIEIEARVIHLLRSLPDIDAEIALGQIEALASRRGKKP